jgi:hypothetical protein
VNSVGILTTAVVNGARFDHNPTTGESLGLLVEEARTNLVLSSEEFDNAAWTKSGTTVTPNASQSPTGATTADLVEVTTSGSSKSVFCNFSSLTASSNYTLSFYAKAGASSTVVAGLFVSVFLGQYTFTLTGAGSVSTGVAGVSASITLAGNGWYRCQLTATTTGTAATVLIYPNSISNVIGNSIYLWGAQLEAGAFATSYIPTTSATVTRAADVASMIGTNFSSWYNQPEGTMLLGGRSAPVNNIAQFSYDISNGTTNERIFSRRNTSGLIATTMVDNGVTQGGADLVVGLAIAASAAYTSAYSYAANNLNLVINGFSPSSFTTASMPTVDRLDIGQNFSGTQTINGTIKRLTYWPVRLSNTTLQTITL